MLIKWFSQVPEYGELLDVGDAEQLPCQAEAHLRIVGQHSEAAASKKTQDMEGIDMFHGHGQGP